MAKLLTRAHSSFLVIAIIGLLILLATMTPTLVYAATYTGWFTGYAMGNQIGAAGVEVSQGHFANHSYGTCGDPASYWPWGTKITTAQSITLHYSNGAAYSRKKFYLEDGGDLNCSQGNYWVDIYFGRYQRFGEPCNCPGSPSNGFCINANYNSCNDAQNFGRTTRTYTGP